MISLFLIFYHFCNEICTHSIYSINSPPFSSAYHCVKCPYSELFWSVTSRIRTEYGEITLRIGNSPTESLHIQSSCRKIRTIIIPNTDTFYIVYGLRKVFCLGVLQCKVPFKKLLVYLKYSWWLNPHPGTFETKKKEDLGVALKISS